MIADHLSSMHASPAPSPAYNAWHHIVWVDNNGSAALYIDGVKNSANFNYTPTSLTIERAWHW